MNQNVKVSIISESNCLCGMTASYRFSLRDHHFYKCPSCTLLFVSPRFDATSIYNSDYFAGGTHGFGFSNYETDKVASKSYLENYLKWLSDLAGDGSKTLLDIGAANGFFVSLATEHGFKAAGLEVSEQAVQWAQKLKRNVRVGTVENFSSSEQFRFVSVLDVLEHIERPKEFLDAINRVMAPGGYLLINVPNSGSITAKLSGKNWHALLPPEHWFYFNSRSLQSLLESSGFQVMYKRAVSKSFSLSYIFLTVLNSPQFPYKVRKLLSKFSWLIQTRLGRAKIYLPLFDNLSIIAIKKP